MAGRMGIRNYGHRTFASRRIYCEYGGRIRCLTDFQFELASLITFCRIDCPDAPRGVRASEPKLGKINVTQRNAVQVRNTPPKDCGLLLCWCRYRSNGQERTD